MTEQLRLEVENSPIEAGGRVRIDKDTLEELNVVEGELIVVSSKNKDILVSVYSDEMMEKGKISIRVKDRKKLEVEEGDGVDVREHKNLLHKVL
ncbi:MAG: hypothetical protein ACLFVL_02570 [Candidatus Aenigmatarchaeota archaeon]